MSNLMKLVQNENMKIYRRVPTWVMLGILVAAILIVAIVQTFIMDNGDKTNWKDAIVQENQQYIDGLNADTYLPKTIKDTYTKQLAINEYRLENDIPPVPSESIWGFINSTANLFSIITLFTIIIAAGSVASEFSWGTIKLLLIRPVSRSKVLLAKYLSAMLFALFLLAALFLVSFLVGALFYGVEGVSHPYLSYVDGEVVESSMTLHIMSIYGLSSVNLIMMTTFAFMISSVFRSSSLAIGLSIFLMFTGGQLVMLLSQYSWVKYILFANTDLNQYFDGTPIVEGMTLQFSLIMLAVYFILFNLFSWVIFNKRDVAA